MQLALDHWMFRGVSGTMRSVPTNPDWKRLAAAVTARRTALGLTQTDVAAAGGPSMASMRLIEGALQASYRPGTLAGLERVLQWQPGSITAILNGGTPTPIAPPTPQPRPAGAEAELRAIADNPGRSDHLRQWARDQLVQLAAIRAANAAEAQARGEDAG